MRMLYLAAFFVAAILSFAIGPAKATSAVTGVPTVCQTPNGGPLWLNTSNGVSVKTLVAGSGTNAVAIRSLLVSNSAGTAYPLTVQIVDGSGNTLVLGIQTIPANAGTANGIAPFNFLQTLAGSLPL